MTLKRKTAQHLTVLSAALSWLIGLSSVAGAQSIAFDIRSAATANPTGELTTLPTVAVVPAGSAAIPGSVAEQLSASVALAKRGLSDADDFAVLTRAESNSTNTRWAFSARTDDRLRYEALVPAFAGRLTACLYALESDSQVGALVALLSSVTVSSDELQSAGFGGQMMLEHWKTDACRTQRNTLVLIAQQSEAISGATRGMLTGRFDGQVFRGEPLLNLIGVLQPLFFESGGLWESDRTPRLQAVFNQAFELGFASARAFDAARVLEFASFFDWVIYLRRMQPTLLRALYQSAGTACLTSAAEASQPFRLQRCLDSGRIHTVSLRFDGNERFSLTSEGTP